MDDLRELKHYTYRLYLTLLKEFVKSNTLLPTPKEEDCVKAFCVLAHAALEEYFEKLTLKTINNSYQTYKSKKIIKTIPVSQLEVDKLNQIINQLIKTLVLSTSYSVFSKSNSDTLKSHKSKLERVTKIYEAGNTLTMQDVAELTKKTESYTKEIIKESLSFFDSYVENNHGASLKYILKLLIPVGIDIPESPLLNSLQKLAEYRGNYAHTRGTLNQIISASDMVKYLIDIIKLCNSIENGINSFNEYAVHGLIKTA